MSPTSYQAAPPRISSVAEHRDGVKFCTNVKYEGKALMWNLKVQIKAGPNSVTLDQRNGTLIER
jgi:hypothetical protein